MTGSSRSYSELVRFQTHLDRFNYLSLSGVVGDPTFGYDRYLNQMFYRSREWRNCRRDVIVRDLGCDLGLPGYEIHERVYVHHMNPMTLEQVEDEADVLLDPEFLICVTLNTHNAIHYGDAKLLPQPMVERKPDDHILWPRMSRRN